VEGEGGDRCGARVGELSGGGRDVFGAAQDRGEAGAERIRASLRRALETGRAEVLPVQRQDRQLGSVPHGQAAARYWVSTATPIMDSQDAVVALLHKIQDVTPVVLSTAADIGAPAGAATVELESHAEVFALARELAEANAQLHQSKERERETSLTLQRAMLPASIPTAAAVRIAARYLPANSTLSVGGDWYDVAELPDGRVAVAVGDVVGQGLQAAAVMGQLRSALSAVTIADVGPGKALQVLDRFARQMDHATATTAVKVVLDIEAGVATYSSAGHLPPLLQHPDGRVEPLDQALGPPLAATAEPDARPEAATRLTPGATLVLYTDGLVERRDEDITDGIARLTGCLQGNVGLDPDQLVDVLIAQVRGHGCARDDTAVLVIRV
jgi:serine phosphatase RsbU (regulator of sigma subunit)